jgi:hypothetical protein
MDEQRHPARRQDQLSIKVNGDGVVAVVVGPVGSTGEPPGERAVIGQHQFQPCLAVTRRPQRQAERPVVIDGPVMTDRHPCPLEGLDGPEVARGA